MLQILQLQLNLQKLLELILEEYGLAMLKAGTNLSSKSAEELIDIDAKDI